MNKELILSMYRDMVKLRIFDEYCVDLKYQDEIQNGFHSYQGQEAVAVGVCTALEERDYLLSTHRGHGHALAKGSEPRKIFAEMMGRIGGVGQGKGGPMNFCDWEHRFLCTSIVGSGIPISTGLGLAIKMRRRSEIVACIFGDGTVNTGAFHEGLNLASVWKLPILFICENNQYGEATPVSKAVAISPLSKRAESYGMEGVTVDGNDVITVYNSVRAFVEEVRKGEGPKFLEAITYRFRGHYEGDPQNYRTKEEIEKWRKRCPILRLKKYLLENNLSSEDELSQIEEEVKEEIEEARNWALASPPPSFNIITKDIL